VRASHCPAAVEVVQRRDILRCMPRPERTSGASAAHAEPAVATALRDAILAWYEERGRPLAFRRTADPYAILVAEAMAQQTQAARAAAYWERFIARFPTADDLAAASPADVLREWAGLGYDRRAVALWRAARIIVARHGGRVPSSVDELQALPGVGPYTARAVAALAYGVPVGAVDVNVRRVLGRIVGGSAGIVPAAALQMIADAAVPAERPAAWTHAVMDLGATLCKPRSPHCGDCPAARWCRFAIEAADTTTRVSDAAAARGADAHPADAHPADARSAAPRAPRIVRERRAPFATTNRWLRGRILDRLRAVEDGRWVDLDGEIGVHDHARVLLAVQALSGDGLVEVEPRADGIVRARLPLS
jgi:A/G-specific adenine glycosylase